MTLDYILPELIPDIPLFKISFKLVKVCTEGIEMTF